ncbi:MAG: hypothetical protein HS103_00535 [Anaerolineales bacterium]|nr:hypothetical protein [Anaerolineales bacterium]
MAKGWKSTVWGQHLPGGEGVALPVNPPMNPFRYGRNGRRRAASPIDAAGIGQPFALSPDAL